LERKERNNPKLYRVFRRNINIIMSLAQIKIHKSQIKAASALLSQAFQDDPLFCYFVPDSVIRKNKLHYLMKTLTHYSVSYGEVYTTSKNFEGVAVWLPSDKVEMNFWRGLKSGGLPIIFNLGIRSTYRQLAISELMYDVHRRRISSPHWYLYLLGVLPELQRKGYAGNLMKPMLERADKEGFDIYLDNTKANNLPMYEHYNFKIIEEYKIPETAISIWAMLRKPQK